MGIHDKLILALNNEKLKELILPKIEQGNFSSFHFLKKQLNEIKLEELERLVKFCRRPYGQENKSPKEAIDIYNSEMNFFKKLNKSESIENFKVEREYKLDKGFVDILITFTNIRKEMVQSYEFRKAHFIIEVKKDKDLEDIGAILRQIKTYRQNYINSYYVDYCRGEDLLRCFVLFENKPKEEIIKLFKNEDIGVMYLNNFFK